VRALDDPTFGTRISAARSGRPTSTVGAA
jgi:hypothetical protein